MSDRRPPPRSPSRPGRRPPRKPPRGPRAPVGSGGAAPRRATPASPSVFQRLHEPAPQQAAPPPRARAERPVSPLGPGPFKVPLSTLDWLVARETPAARYVALRVLMGKLPKDIEVRKARQALRQDLYLRDALAQLRARLVPSASFAELARPYDGGFWQALFLTEMGCDQSEPELLRAADVLFARFEHALVEIERGEEPSLDLTLFTAVLRALAQMGHASDPRVVAGTAHVAHRRIVGGSAAASAGAGGASELLLFTTLPETVRPGMVQRGIEFLVERALQVELPRERSRSLAGSFGFPNGAEPDMLELLQGLARAGVRRRPELEPALALAAAKADHRGRFTLERALLRPPALAPEREGELSRWVTIRGLEVMQHFLGLEVMGAR